LPIVAKVKKPESNQGKVNRVVLLELTDLANMKKSIYETFKRMPLVSMGDAYVFIVFLQRT